VVEGYHLHWICSKKALLDSDIMVMLVAMAKARILLRVVLCSSHGAECMSKGSTHFWKPCIRAVENSRNGFLCETPFLSFLSMDQCMAQCTYLKLVGVLFQGHTSCKVLDQYV
jgi:hypothetical protein